MQKSKFRHQKMLNISISGSEAGARAMAKQKAAMITFGELIANRRKRLNFMQKEIAAAIKQDDGKAISVQYLNDVEHGRRGAPPDYVIAQLAKLLRLPLDLLYFRAGRLPADIRKRAVSDQQAAAAYRALRRELRRPKKS
jgi:transcriptional regulator with XRE-family HTH domain